MNKYQGFKSTNFSKFTLYMIEVINYSNELRWSSTNQILDFPKDTGKSMSFQAMTKKLLKSI